MIKRKKNKKKFTYIICIFTLILCSFIYAIKIKSNNEINNKDILPTQVEENNYNNRIISLLSKPLGSDTFSEITSTPTSGTWTITTDCRGMNVTWDNDNYRLKSQVTQTLANCKVSFIETLPTLVQAIKRDNPEYTTQIVASNTMFQSNATTDMGLWTENRTGKTEGNLPSYFFRGAVADNYVKFGSDASGNLIWRIIRINEDGSVRMILDKKLPSDNAFQIQSVELFKQNMYMPNNEVISGSAANVLNTWYNTTLTATEKAKVNINAIYCNDMSVDSVSGNYIYFSARTRLAASSPQYKCSNANDKLVSTASSLNASNVNKVLLQPVGLITADEIMYAGETWSTNNTFFYLHKSYWLWSMTPQYIYTTNSIAYGFIVHSGVGLADSLAVYFGGALVPVITLKSNVLTTGTGVVGDEYIIQ